MVQWQIKASFWPKNIARSKWLAGSETGAVDCSYLSCRKIKPICLKCTATVSFHFLPLVCVSTPTVSKAKVYPCRPYFRCETVFNKKIFMRAGHKFAAICRIVKILTQSARKRCWKPYHARYPAALMQYCFIYSHTLPIYPNSVCQSGVLTAAYCQMQWFSAYVEKKMCLDGLTAKQVCV